MIDHHKKPRYDVIVVGAGLAGLSAARALAQRGFEVIVLEGRNRIGAALAQALADRSLTDAERMMVDWHMTLSARDDYGTDAEALSFQWRDDGFEVYGYGDSVFVNGYGAVIQQLAEGLDIRLEHLVEQIKLRNVCRNVQRTIA